jgi:hypothetical protein
MGLTAILTTIWVCPPNAPKCKIHILKENRTLVDLLGYADDVWGSNRLSTCDQSRPTLTRKGPGTASEESVRVCVAGRAVELRCAKVPADVKPSASPNRVDKQRSEGQITGDLSVDVLDG